MSLHANQRAHRNHHRRNYHAHSTRTTAILERLASLEPKTLACQHGSAFRGDGAGLLRELAGILEAELQDEIS